MKTFIVFAVVLAAALAAPASPDADAQVLKNDLENIGIGQHSASYATSNGISAEEQGQLQNAGAENEAYVVRGVFTYTGPDGVVYSVNYVADENGFQPRGAHLPVPPQ